MRVDVRVISTEYLKKLLAIVGYHYASVTLASKAGRPAADIGSHRIAGQNNAEHARIVLMMLDDLEPEVATQQIKILIAKATTEQYNKLTSTPTVKAS